MATELLIFDCDRVSTDSAPVASGLLAEAPQRSGMEVSAADVHRRFTGASKKENRRRCADGFGLTDFDRVFSDAAGMPVIGLIDPANPRDGRRAVLKGAGASLVAEGAAELATAIGSMSLAVEHS